MVPQAYSLDTLLAFDRSLRLECDIARIVMQDDGRSLILLPVRGGRLTLTYKPDRISLRYEFNTLQGTSYIAYDSEGLRLPTKNHPCPMDANSAAKYIVEQLMKGKMP
jgi:hypothetical protein